MAALLARRGGIQSKPNFMGVLMHGVIIAQPLGLGEGECCRCVLGRRHCVARGCQLWPCHLPFLRPFVLHVFASRCHVGHMLWPFQ
jgi:hypothetical protein